MNNLPLNALRVFDAAARHMNFVKAAKELCLTQGAVSKQIQNLEQRLGVTLFIRGPRSLRFTEAGDLLAAHTSRMFTDLNAVAERLGGKRSRQTLKIAVARSFAARVMARHIQEFCAQFPWVDLYIDGQRHMADLLRGEADAAIRVGDGKWPDLKVESLGEEFLTPVCSPRLLQRNGPLDTPDDLRRFTLLHYAEQRQWSLWLEKVGATGVDLAKGIRFSETIMMLEAAEAGQGIAIARMSLVQDELSSNRLVRPFNTTVADTHSYYFCATERSLERPMVKAFRGWLLNLTRSLSAQQ